MSYISPASILHNTSGTEVGTATDPVRVDPTGDTAQPVSDNGGSLTVDGSVSVSNLPAVQPVSDNGGSLTVDGTVAVSGTVPVSGPLTDTQLRATPVPVSGTVTANAGTGPWPVTDNGGSLTVDGTFWQATQPVSVASLPLPTGAATSANQTNGAQKAQRVDAAGNISPAGDTVARAQFEQISDGTTGPVAVKGPSTSPVAADKALVVVLSPNQTPIPVTSAPANSFTGVSSGFVTLGGGSANTLNHIRATTYNEPTANAQRSIASSSANDTSAGSGARTVRITYFTSTGVGPLTETLTLTGTAPVNTTNSDICYIEELRVMTVGTVEGSNTGTITLYNSIGGGGGVLGTIGFGLLVPTVGDGKTHWSHHYVPTGKTASLATYIVAAAAIGSGTAAMFFLRSAPLPVGVYAETIISDLLLTVGPIVRTLGIPIKVVGPAKIEAYGVPVGQNYTLTASFDYSEI